LIQSSGASAIINGNAYWGSASGSCPGGEQIATDAIVKGKIIEAPGVPFPPIVPSFTDTASPNSDTDDCSGKPSYLIYNTTNIASYNPDSAAAPPAGHYRKCDTNRDVWLCVPGDTTKNAYFFLNHLKLGSTAVLVMRRETSPGVCDASSALCTSSTCAKARVYINMEMDVRGTSATDGVSDPRWMSFFYSGSGDAYYRGTTQCYGTIYAPFATVHVSGTADIFGSITALNVEDKGTGQVHYDLSLQNTWGSASPFRIINQSREVF
jgi:hypothetical protein